MHLLVVEDEAKTRAYLAKGFREAGFTVDAAGDAAEARYVLRDTKIDLLICDVMLPGEDGWSLLRGLRQNGLQIPVLFLTAKESVNDRVTGFDAGGDDYLVKPFAFAELLARVRALLRRRGDMTALTLRAADLAIDPVRRVVTRGTDEIHLTNLEFSLLVMLVERKDEVLTRTEIAERVWDLHFDTGTNVVDVAIRRLRQKVDDPYPNKLIQTVRGVGYVLREL
ncbi:MAG: heavy metal response regulator transcription factor [Acidobacteria bacterium]|nr:heavy metal response regulator transcription factor [Acidobacteriota bacterium]